MAFDRTGSVAVVQDAMTNATSCRKDENWDLVEEIGWLSYLWAIESKCCSFRQTYDWEIRNRQVDASGNKEPHDGHDS